jgi:hypothetical protein
MNKFCVILCAIFFWSCSSQDAKINGISFVASGKLTNQEHIETLLDTKANWVTLMPFAFMKSLNDTVVHYNSERQWVGERKEGIVKATQVFKNNQIKIMLKPQIWIRNGFTGHIDLNTEKEWIAFENNYEKFILFYAEIAQEQNIELLCIGTELNSFVSKRPEFWNQLIVKIKSVYKGKFTYAENWDTFASVPFFDQLDYIGIDAYFPLIDSKEPSLKEIETAWEVHKTKIEDFSKKINKQVLFTEYGYQSSDFTTHEPWDFAKERITNHANQKNALQAIYNEFWNEEWFAGGFLWKWFDEETWIKDNDTGYTVQKKPALETLKKHYKKTHY